MRWTLELQEYNYAIQHCKSSDNHVADILNRTVYNYFDDGSYKLAAFEYVVGNELTRLKICLGCKYKMKKLKI